MKREADAGEDAIDNGYASGGAAGAELGLTLYKLRLSRGLSLRVLARRLGMSGHGGLTEYEKGRRIPPEDVVVACERVLGVRDGQLRRLRERALAERAEAKTRDLRIVLKPAGAIPVAQLPADLADFAGREAELLQLRSELGGIVVVSGTPGVGKTALVVHVAHLLAADYPDAHLYCDLRGAHDPAEPAGVLANVIRALGVSDAQLPPDLDGRIGLFRSLLHGRRAVLVLDEVADEAQVRPLLPGGPSCLTLITSRSRLSGLSGVRRLGLEVPQPEEAVRLLAGIVGRERAEAEPEAARELARMCGQLPLALRIVGNRLAAWPGWTLAQLTSRLADEHSRLGWFRVGDLDVRRTFSTAYDAVDEPCRRLFLLLSIVPGPLFGPEAAAELAGASMLTAEMMLDRLAEAGLIEAACGPDRYRLHELVRLYAAERLRAQADAGSVAGARLPRSRVHGAYADDSWTLRDHIALHYRYEWQAGGHGVVAKSPYGSLVGREWECRALERTVRGLTDGSARLIEITGEPGVGKTRMLSEIAAMARSRGLPVLVGRTGLVPAGTPLGVLVNALDDYLSTVGDELLGKVASRHREPLAAIFPSFPLEAQATAGRSGSPDSYRTYLGVRALLERLASSTPLVITLDDLHRADDETIELIRQLLSSPPHAPVLLAFAYRPRQASAPLSVAVEMAHDLTRMPLAPLTESQTSALLDERVSPGRRRLLHEKSGGNPYYLEALLEAKEPGLTGISDVETREPAPRVTSGVRAELDALPPAARLVASAAAVLADGFEPSIVAEVAGLNETRVYPAIDELVGQDLMRPMPGTGRFAFRHPLVRHAVYHNTPAGWRLRAHARAAAALEAVRASAVARAPHIARIAVPGDLPALHLLADAAMAVERESPLTAAQWLRAALGLLPASATPGEEHLKLLTALARSLAAAGRPAEGCELLERALGALPADTAARHGLVVHCADMKRQLGRDGEAWELISTGLEAIADTDAGTAGFLAGRLACLDVACGRLADAVEHGLQALKLAERSQVGSSVICAVGALAAADSFRGSVHAAADRLGDVVPLLESLPDSELAPLLDGVVWIAWSEVFLERWSDALRHFDRAADVARATGNHVALSHALTGRILVLSATGSLTAAAAAASEAVDAGEASGGQELKSNAQALMYLVAARSGDQDTLRRYVAGPSLPAVGGWFAVLARWAAAEISLARGDTDACLELSGQAGAPELDAVGGLLRVGWYELLTRAALGAGRPDAAKSWALRAGAQARRLASPGRTGLGLLAHAHVLALREPAAAARTAMMAAKALTTAGMAIDAARARVVAGTALAACGEPDRARAVLRLAQEAFQDGGAHHCARRVAAELLSLGERWRGERDRRRHVGLSALTNRERQVAQLVSEGLKNSEIAKRLFVTEKTIEMHISNAFIKLGVPNRAGMVRALLGSGAS